MAIASQIRTSSACPLLQRLQLLFLLMVGVAFCSTQVYAFHLIVPLSRLHSQSRLDITRQNASVFTRYINLGPYDNTDSVDVCTYVGGRAAFFRILTFSLVMSATTTPKFAEAKTGQMKTAQFAGKPSSSTKRKVSSNPKNAFQSLLKAKLELVKARDEFFNQGDFQGLQKYLTEEAENMNLFEQNTAVLLSSKLLSDEDKKAIGTIRTYGVGADVMIMYGGLLAAINEMNDEPDAAAADKFLKRTLDSLNDVITICREGGGFD